MNIQEYIASGILEAYVLGDVTPEERTEVEKYLLEYPELREELNRIEATQEELLMTAAIKPSPDLRNKVLAGLPDKETPVRTMDTSGKGWNIPWRIVAAASIFFAVVAGGMAFLFYQNWQRAADQLNTLIAQNQQIAGNYNEVQNELENIRGDLQVMSDPSYERVSLKRPEGGVEAQVYWNQETQQVYLRTLSLTRLAENQQYQLWALIDGNPIDAGVFDVDTGILRMKNIAAADAFAVTIEPRGGSVNPTLSELQVIGETL